MGYLVQKTWYTSCITSCQMTQDLGSEEILGQSQIWVETQSRELNLGNNSQKTRKSRYKTFLIPCSFTGSLYPAPNTPSGIV